MTNTEVGGQLGIYGGDGICTKGPSSKNPVTEEWRRSKMTVVSPASWLEYVQ